MSPYQRTLQMYCPLISFNLLSKETLLRELLSFLA